MPPSPAMRCSPGRELRADDHKRGRSLESGILLRERDDDLALFNEVQSRERDNFLLQSNDDFEDTFTSKLRCFSDYKLGVSIPVRGENSGLLNAEGDKNDYDWLLTPPDTPLFPSLEDEAPPVINLAQRGRSRTQPISISRSSTMEKSHRSSRGSASPNRLSPSPRSGNNTFQPRGRSSSAPTSSPPANLQHATASWRPSPPSKPSTPAPRSSTPTPRRLSTGSSGTMASSGVRGTSPIKTSRGNSASPKVRAWQSNIPGFSTEAPPNLRTSLADRPASYVRGSSPASRNGRDSSSRSGRQSMSPTASRSISSSHSHDRDRCSSQSKGSVASSGEDDMESLPFITVGSSERSSSRRVGGLTNNKASFSKKPNRTVSSSSAPKRSFDLALRQMDHRKSPQNMFRPLLSSVPSSTFYAGKESAAHRTMMSRNSSVTTSSNASSDLGTSGVHDNDNELNQEDVTSGYVKVSDGDVEDELFVFDKTDALDIGHEVHNRLPNSQIGELTLYSQLGGSENLSNHDTSTSVALDDMADLSDYDALKDMLLCSRCGCRYSPIESIEKDMKLCPDCSKSYSPLTIITPGTTLVVAETSPKESLVTVEEQESFKALEPEMSVVESPELTSTGEARSGQREDLVKDGQSTYSEPIWNFFPESSLSRPLSEECEQRHANHQVISPPSVSSMPNSDAGSERIQYSGDFPNLKVDVLEGAGISILLKRSSSSKGRVVQSRNFSASSISYDDLSYVRDSTNSMRSSVGHGSVSASSSVDFGSSRLVETRFQRQLSSRKSDIENYKHDMNARHQRSGSSLSGTSSHVGRDVAHMGRDVADTACISSQEQLLASENTAVDVTCTDIENNNNGGTSNVSTTELSSQTPVNLGDSALTSFSNFEESGSYENVEDSTDNSRNRWDVEASSLDLEATTVKEDALLNSCVDSVDVAEIPTRSSLDAISEGETENTCQYSHGSRHDAVSQSSESSTDELEEPPVSNVFDKDIAVSIKECDTSDRAVGILEESTVVVGGQRGIKARSLTLEEATDTILFCSSIVHNLAYEAATIAINKENSNSIPLEGSWPLVPTMGKDAYNKKEPRSINASKRASKSQKVRQRKVETETKPPSSTNSDDNKSDLPTTRIVGVHNNGESTKPPKLESKCNCTIM